MKTKTKGASAWPAPPMDRSYVVRYGLWGPRIYLGLPAVAALVAISLVANMPGWLFYAWNGFLAIIAYLCVVQKEVRIVPNRSVIVVRKFLALVPLWRRTHPIAEFSAVRRDGGSVGFQGEADTTVVTVSLERPDGTVIALQSWSAGAMPAPGPEQFMADIVHLTGLRQR